MEITAQPPVAPAWASTAVTGLLSGPPRDLPVLASTGAAAYLADPGPGPPAVVLALLAEGAVRLPLGICVAAGPLPEAGTTARAGGGTVTAAGRTWRPARWWDPRPRLDAPALLRYGPRLLPVVADAPAAAFGMPLPDAFAVAGALAAGDPAPAVNVIGLGPGLTPAADDVIAGALAVLALTGRLSAAARRAVEARAATHTTGLSAALVAAAARGEVIPQAARVLAALAGGAPAGRVASAAGGLLRVGHTSGHDLCAGMAGALAHMGGQ
jgi:Protein of unknown function (DUF2877)